MCAHEMKMQGAPKDWTRYFKQHGVFHINCHLEDVTLKPAHRWSERIPALVESCLETVHGSGDQRRIHACAFPLLWRHQSQRWRSVCLACRGFTTFLPRMPFSSAGEATFLAILAQSPPNVWWLCGKLDGLRVEWQRILAGLMETNFIVLLLWSLFGRNVRP